MHQNRYDFNTAIEVAERFKEDIKPYCIRCEIAGSLRRKKPTVGDIELVIIPKKINAGLFEEYADLQPVPELVRIINKYKKVKGDIAAGKYTQRILPEGIKLDLFTATPDNWGYILAMRTGSSSFSYQSLACKWKALGYSGENGMLTKQGKLIPVREEEELFKLLNLQWVEPEYRL